MKAYTLDNVNFNVLPEMTLDEAVQYVKDNEHNPEFFAIAEVTPVRFIPTARELINTTLEYIYEDTGDSNLDVSTEAEQELQKFLVEWYDKYLGDKVIDIVDILYTCGVK